MNINENRLSEIIKEELQNYYKIKNKTNIFNKTLNIAANNAGIKLNSSDFIKIQSMVKEQNVLDFTPAITVDLEETELSTDEDETAKMSKSQLFHIAKEAQSLHDKIEDADSLPQWIQAKIAVMADNIDAVANHLDYKIHREDL